MDTKRKINDNRLKIYFKFKKKYYEYLSEKISLFDKEKAMFIEPYRKSFIVDIEKYIDIRNIYIKIVSDITKNIKVYARFGSSEFIIMTNDKIFPKFEIINVLKKDSLVESLEHYDNYSIIDANECYTKDKIDYIASHTGNLYTQSEIAYFKNLKEKLKQKGMWNMLS